MKYCLWLSLTVDAVATYLTITSRDLVGLIAQCNIHASFFFTRRNAHEKLRIHFLGKVRVHFLVMVDAQRPKYEETTIPP